MLDEPVAVATDESRDRGSSPEVEVRGELAVATVEWSRNVTPLEFSVMDDGAEELFPQEHAVSDRAAELAELHQQIAAKDELISALVSELEQVVEQFDRLQRSGATRLHGAAALGGGALPAEVVEEHQQVLGDLQRVVQQWEALQAASVLGRIESEVAELRALVVSGRGFPSQGDAAPVEAVSADKSLDDVLSRLAIGQQARSDSEPEPNGASWDSMKCRMLEEEAPGREATTESDDVDHGLDGVIAPHPVDIDEATLDGLKNACAERDAYIVQITRLLRARRAVTLPENWDELSAVPDDLRAKVNHLTSRLEEQVRLAEVEMSLERARLSRERTQLQAEREVIEKHLKRLGINSLGDLETVAVEGSSTSDRRWMRFLGVNRRG